MDNRDAPRAVVKNEYKVSPEEQLENVEKLEARNREWKDQFTEGDPAEPLPKDSVLIETIGEDKFHYPKIKITAIDEQEAELLRGNPNVKVRAGNI